ncbi:hypothetical protein P11VFA_095 [Rhizobium phage P11VFA]|nr:hypothetical protein P11VFA_095 [Rhizobium phage P11VFA]
MRSPGRLPSAGSRVATCCQVAVHGGLSLEAQSVWATGMRLGGKCEIICNMSLTCSVDVLQPNRSLKPALWLFGVATKSSRLICPDQTAFFILGVDKGSFPS